MARCVSHSDELAEERHKLLYSKLDDTMMPDGASIKEEENKKNAPLFSVTYLSLCAGVGGE